MPKVLEEGPRRSVCPNCVKIASAEKERLWKQLADQYGVVGYVVYQHLQGAYQRASEELDSVNDTLRLSESTQWLLTDGNLHLVYTACCPVCDFTYQHVYRRNILVPEEDQQR